jgi:hypothetical protein
MNHDIEVASTDDWAQLFRNRLDLIVDPMILRAGDVFLRGRAGATATLSNRDPVAIWAALTSDIGSLISFFDQLVLTDALPVIDYGVTFDSALKYDTPWLCTQVNEAFDAKVLHTVHVYGDASRQARAAALAQLPICPRPAGELEYSVRKHLNALDYEWRPDLGEIEARYGEAQAAIQRFLYGGLVFGAFAQACGATHLLQPKRACLSLALALNWPTSQDGDEAALYAELRRRIASSPETRDLEIQFVGLPSVLPYLLSKVQHDASPMQLLAEARTLRSSGPLRDYRQWRRELFAGWRERGTIKRGRERDIKRMLVAATKEISIGGGVEAEGGAEASIAGVALKASLKSKLDVGQLWWGWVNRLIPGKRYTKLLTRMRVADYELARPDTVLANIWARG